MAHHGPNRDPWDPPRPRQYPPRPAGRPSPGRRWPVNTTPRGANEEDNDDE